MLDFIFVQVMLFFILIPSYLLFKFASTKNANSFFGYRTKQSTFNLNNWKKSNMLCASYILILSFVNMFIGLAFVGLFYFQLINYNENYLYLIIVQIVLSFIFIYFKIENKLKNDEK